MMQDEKADDLHPEGPLTLARDRAPTGSLGKQARKRIGTHLRAMYDSVVQQPIPSRFTELIAQLDDTPNPPAADEA